MLAVLSNKSKRWTLFKKKKEPEVKEEDLKEDWIYVVEQDKEFKTTGEEAVKFD